MCQKDLKGKKGKSQKELNKQLLFLFCLKFIKTKSVKQKSERTYRRVDNALHLKSTGEKGSMDRKTA